jgi:hypothetical protein
MSDTTSPYDDEVVDPYAGDDTKNPHEQAVEGEEEEAAPDDGDGADPPKRRPGRPRKNPDTAA